MHISDKNYDEISVLYKKLLNKFIVLNNIKRIDFLDELTNPWRKLFSHIEVENGEVKVYAKAYKTTATRCLPYFCFDWTSDYASLLLHLEEELLAENNRNFMLLRKKYFKFTYNE